MRQSRFRGRRLPVAAAFVSFAALPAAIALLPLPAQARPQTAAPAPAAPAAKTGKAFGQAAWDENYIYFAFQVDDSNITGTNTKPMSNPEQDDSVGVYFQTGSAKPEAPDASTHAMIVSVAGGFTFLEGSPASKAFAPKPTFTIKYGITTQGTLNRTDDRDHSYTITMAIPWDAIGIDPKTLKPGTELGFNVVARSRDAATLESLAPGIANEAETSVPSKWGRLVLAAPDGTGATPGNGVTIATRIAPDSHPPLIDGGYRQIEWPGATRIAWASPDKMLPQVVVAPARPADYAKDDESAPALRFDQPLSGMEKLVMARYRIDYQADRRKITMPMRDVLGNDDGLLLHDQPATGIGPWFSADRPSYHRAELAALRHAGIDAALVEIGGPEGDDALFDEKTLLSMVSGLRELTAIGTPAPLVAPYFDMARLGPATEKLDLSTPRGRDRLYAAIRRWVRLVPPEMRLRVTLPEGASPTGTLVNAYPIFLGDSANVVSPGDSLWTDTIRDRFAKDFGIATGGTTLIFAGEGAGWQASAPKIAATLATGSGAGTGVVSTSVVQPGSAAKGAALVPRRDTATYRESWAAAITAKPSWVVVDSWNDFTLGTEVTASRQYGLRYSDLTRIFTIQAAGLPDRAVRWLSQDAPRRMRPGQVVTTTVAVENIGKTILSGDEGIALTYRWLQNGKVVAEGPLKLKLAGSFLPATTAHLPIGLTAASFDADGHATPLPPGDYVVEIDLGEVHGIGSDTNTKLFSEMKDGSPSLRVSVTIAPDLADYVQISGTTTPSLMVGNATYPSQVRIRWMGAEPLPPDSASLIYQVLTEDGSTTVRTGTVHLTEPLTPGMWTTIPANVETGEGGVTIPPAYPEQRGQKAGDASVPGAYRIRWLLARTQSVEPVPGEYDEEIAVYPPDDIAAVVAPKPKEGQTFDASALVYLPVSVTNLGATPWKAGSYALSYHWYDPDGIETQWKPVTNTAIDHDVAPGETIKVDAAVRMPHHDGTYILAFDVFRGPDVYLSTRPVTSSSDLGLMPVRVSGGPLVFVDLDKLFTVDALAPEADTKDGDFDGKGSTFPAESFPPDRYGIIAYLAPDPDDIKQKFGDKAAYPSGFYCQPFAAARETAFRYGSDAPGQKNAVACTGQTLQVSKGHYYGLHFAAASSDGTDQAFAVTLTYKDGTKQTVTRTVLDWAHVPGPNDAIAVQTPSVRTPSSDTAGVRSVWHIVIPVDVTRELESVTLPDSKAIKVFAVTLEKE